jgi:transcriptional regulator with XRE-family HTH domain
MADVPLDGPIGHRIRIYRGRRGLSQRELAGLIGRSESWLSQVERGVRSVDRFSVLVDIAQVLKTNVQTLVGTRMQYAPSSDTEVTGMDAVSAALMTYPSLGVTHPQARIETQIQDAERLCTEAHARYQAADYVAAARILPHLIESVEVSVRHAQASALRRALTVQHHTYIVTAKLFTKVGDAHLAWLAADRAATAATRLDSPTLEGLAAYQVSCALLDLDRILEAERVALAAAENIEDSSPLGISVQGALFLIAAVISGRRSDRTSAMARLRRARYLAGVLGEDGDYGWTGFGPTNVDIHHVSVAVELGDAETAIRYAGRIDTSNLPDGLRSRRAQVHLDAAWAYAQRKEDAAAVINLMETERVAPQVLQYNVVARDLLRGLLKRERRPVTPGLHALAVRAGVLQ